MSAPVIDTPIVNSPFAEPARYWVLGEQGVPTGTVAAGRRRTEFVVPVLPAKHQVNAQATLDLDDPYGQRKPKDDINEIRARVAAWRALGKAPVEVWQIPSVSTQKCVPDTPVVIRAANAASSLQNKAIAQSLASPVPRLKPNLAHARDDAVDVAIDTNNISRLPTRHVVGKAGRWFDSGTRCKSGHTGTGEKTLYRDRWICR